MYPFLERGNMSKLMLNHACCCISLWQTVAVHPLLCGEFLSSRLVVYLYPFMNTIPRSRPFEYLKFSSLGVVASMLKSRHPDVIPCLFSTDFMGACFRMMRIGSPSTKKLATFVFSQIVSEEHGLALICSTEMSVQRTVEHLNGLTVWLVGNPTSSLIRMVIACYERLTHNSCCREYLKKWLPRSLSDHKFAHMIVDDGRTKKYHGMLLEALGYEMRSPNTVQGFSFE